LQENKISEAIQLIDDSLRSNGNSYDDSLKMYSNNIRHYLSSAKLIVMNLQRKDGYMIYECIYETFNQALFLCYLKYEWGNENSLIHQIRVISDEELKQYNNSVYK